jgi:hypothetical protein
MILLFVKHTGLLQYFNVFAVNGVIVGLVLGINKIP